MRPGQRRRSGKRAFSVLEMTVAAFLLMVAMGLAARLLQDVGMQIAWSGRKALEVSPNLALEQIRTDLRASHGTSDSMGMWQGPPLAVQGSSTGYVILYLIEENQLLRRTIGPEGVQDRVVLDQVVDLQYRYNRNAVEIEIEFLRMRPPLRRDTAAGMRELDSPEHHKMSILVSPRRVATERF
jgi:hypothetical protein